VTVTVELDLAEYEEIEDNAEGAVELVCMMVQSQAVWPEEGVTVQCEGVVNDNPLEEPDEEDEEEEDEEEEEEDEKEPA
jgi:hypothetical protein